MHYHEVPKNKYTWFGIKTEPIAREYYKNTQHPHHKHLTVGLWLFSKTRILTLRGIIRWNCFMFMPQKACTRDQMPF